MPQLPLKFQHKGRQYTIIPTLVAVSTINPLFLDDALKLLVQAFENEPFHAAIEPDDSSRRRTSTEYILRCRMRLFRQNSYLLLRKAEGEQEEEVVGHAALSAPDAAGMSPSPIDLLFAGFLAAPFYLGWAGFNRFNKELAKFKRGDGMKGMWTLEAVAISANLRGQGVGSEFMMRLLSLSSSANLIVPTGETVYLATQLEENVRFYERLGFKVVEKQSVGYDNWLMTKDI